MLVDKIGRKKVITTQKMRALPMEIFFGGDFHQIRGLFGHTPKPWEIYIIQVD